MAESAVMLNVQSLVPEQPPAEPVPPLQPVNVELAKAAADNVIGVLVATVHVPVLPAQFSVQCVPAVTLPAPEPNLFTVRVFPVLNAAVQFLAAFIVIAQVVFVPQDEQSSLHPAKYEPPPAVAVRLTFMPDKNENVQKSPQFIPNGLLVTVPLPVLEIVKS